MPTNRRFALRRRPHGRIDDETFELIEEELPKLGDGEALVRTEWVSLDPTNRGWISDAPGYLPPVAIGETMRGLGMGRVIESKHPGYEEGQLVQGLIGWTEHFVASDAAPLQRVPVVDGVSPSLYLGVLGMTGLTAWVGMREIGQPREGETVVVSLGGTVATALDEVPGDYVARLVIIDQAPEERFSKGLGLSAELSTAPVLGPALWQVTPDFAVKEGLEVAFAPGYDVPDEFVDEFNRMTYTSYDSDGAEAEYMDAEPLDRRIETTGTPLLAIFGSEDQLYDAKGALAAYAKVPGAKTVLIPGAGHSPNVEKPARTARLVLAFAG